MRHEVENLGTRLGELKPKTKPPATSRVLAQWIEKAQETLGERGQRLGWLVASTLVSAALQRVVDGSGTPSFLLKGGTLLQYRLPAPSRTTKDVDGLIRGDIDEFLARLDESFAEPLGPFALERGEVAIIPVPNRIVKPRRFYVLLKMRGQTWRRIQVEIAANEGGAGNNPEKIPAPTLKGFGLQSAPDIFSLAMNYQIAQKIHAVTDPHDPPQFINDRARDIVDLVLLRNLVKETGAPTDTQILAAVLDVFRVRKIESEAMGTPTRQWPTRVVAHAHWKESYAAAAQATELELSMDEAVTQLNEWLDSVENAIQT